MTDLRLSLSFQPIYPSAPIFSGPYPWPIRGRAFHAVKVVPPQPQAHPRTRLGSRVVVLARAT